MNGSLHGDGPGANGLEEDEDAAGEDEDGDATMETDDAIHLSVRELSFNLVIIETRRSYVAGVARRGSSASRSVPNGSIPSLVCQLTEDLKMSSYSQPFRDDRPNLTPNLDNYPALARTPFSMTHLIPSPLSHSGPTYAEKGKAKELVAFNPAPGWYPTAGDDDVRRAEGSWYTAMSRDEAFIGGLPATSSMSMPSAKPVKRIPSRRKSINQVNNAGPSDYALISGQPKSPRKRTVKLEDIVHRTVDELHSARNIANSIYDWQRLEADGGIIPPIKRFDREEALRKEEEAERKRVSREEAARANKRRKVGGEVGENEAAMSFKRATAGMLAHAGFDGMSKQTFAEDVADLQVRMRLP